MAVVALESRSLDARLRHVRRRLMRGGMRRLAFELLLVLTPRVALLPSAVLASRLSETLRCVPHSALGPRLARDISLAPYNENMQYTAPLTATSPAHCTRVDRPTSHTTAKSAGVTHCARSACSASTSRPL